MPPSISALQHLEVLDIHTDYCGAQQVPEEAELPECLTALGALSGLCLTSATIPKVVEQLPALSHLIVTGLYDRVAAEAEADRTLDHVKKLLLAGPKHGPRPCCRYTVKDEYVVRPGNVGKSVLNHGF